MKMTNPNMIAIASGQTYHCDDVVRVYRAEWEKQGFELPEWEPTGKKPNPKTEFTRGCGCAKRKAAMNRVIPGSGDLAERILSSMGIRPKESEE